MLDFVIIAGLLYNFFGFSIQSSWSYVVVILVVLAIEGALLYNMSRLKPTTFMCWVAIQVMGIVFSILFFIWNGRPQNFLLRES